MSPAEYEQLVEFLGGRFAEIHRRFNEVDHRFAAVDRRFNEIDGRFDAVDARFDDLRRDMLGHLERLGH